MYLQEILLERDPTGWQMLCGCVLLNRTRRAQVDKVWPGLFELRPTPESWVRSRMAPERVIEMLRPLGLQRQRYGTFCRLAKWWVTTERDRNEAITEMEPPGIGEYARDSWVIFKLGRRPGWTVADHALLQRLEEVG